MAADQRRKRMNSANVIGFSSREHYRAKRKKIASSDHISLEWDRNQSKVVSKREQVGLSFRHLRQFVDSAPPRRNLLAQVCHVPHETFQLENLSEVLSKEVWEAFLSDGERDYLGQFLPEGLDVEQVLQALLDGENFHFGNPLLDWGTAVCSSKTHPDQIVYQEECLRAEKRRYFSDLEKYHNDIIDYLQMLKDKWESCKDPEKEVVKKMWGRSRGGSAHVNGSCHDLTGASESSSWNADDKPCSSDNKIPSVAMTGEVQKRRKSTAAKKEKSQGPLIALDNVVNVDEKAGKKDKILKNSIQQTDGAKYMSYLKISKKQHQIVTSMKQAGKSIQSKALNRVLGDIDNLNVQPYGLFVEEEQKKLNAHWLQLVKDLPAAYAIWKKLQLQKRNVISSLERELKDKHNPLMEDKQQLYRPENPLQKHGVQLHSRNSDRGSLNPNETADMAPDVEDSGIFSQVSGKNHSPSKDSSSYGDQNRDSGRCLQVGTSPSQLSKDLEEKQYSSPCSPSRCHDIKQKDVEANDYSSSMQGLDDASPVSRHCVPELENALRNERIPSIASNHGEDSQFCSGGDVWQPVGGIRQSYIGRQAYNPNGGLSIIHHPEGDGEDKNCFIDLASDMPEEVDSRKMLQRKANNSFVSFPNNDQNELLQSLFKVPLNEEHTQIMGIGFQQEGSNDLMESSQFSGQFQDQLPTAHGLSQDQQRQVSVYGQGSISDNIYCDGRGYLMQRPDWNTNCAQIGVTTQPQLNIGPLLNQDWQSKSIWANTDVTGCPSQGSQPGTDRDQNHLIVATNAEQIIHMGSGSDQSLFSVLSHCNQLHRPGTAFEPESSSDQVVASVNYGMLMGGGTTLVGGNLAQPVNPLDYLSGSNPATSLMPDDVAWINQSRQNPSPHNPLGKLYPPRSWNQ